MAEHTRGVADVPDRVEAIRTHAAAWEKFWIGRLDLEVDTPLLAPLQARVTAALRRLAEPQAARAAGLYEARMLQRGDPARVTYSFILMERSERGNLVRVQADSTDDPFDVNEQAKLDLEAAEKQLADLPERARKAGALPGWIRE